MDVVAAPAGEIDGVETASDFAHVIVAKKWGRPPKSATQQPSSHPSSSQPSSHPSSSQLSTSQSSNYNLRSRKN